MNNEILEKIIGNWRGTLTVGGVQVPLFFSIKNDSSEQLIAELVSQGKEITSTNISLDNDKLLIDISAIGGKLEGVYQLDNNSINATWSQSGQKFDIILEHSEENPKIKRPQEPHKPYRRCKSNHYQTINLLYDKE